MSQSHEPTRLILVLEAGDGATERLAAALAAAPVASVVIVAGHGRSFDAASVAPLVAAAQKAGAAALIAGDARLARVLKADGIHLPASETLADDYVAARELISPRFIAGVDAGASRHDAMSAGEAGADYVGFSIAPAMATALAPALTPALTMAEERAAAVAERLELVAWWAEIFEVPCVAFDVASLDEARALAEAGADFIGVEVGADASPAAIRDRVAAFGAAVAAPRVAIES